MKLEFKWLNKYPDYEIHDDEDFCYIYHKGKIIETYSNKSSHLTQDFLKKKINKLERIAKNE